MGLPDVHQDVISFDAHRIDFQAELGEIPAYAGLEFEPVAVALAGDMLPVLEECARKGGTLVGALGFYGVDRPLDVDQQDFLPVNGDELLSPGGDFRNLGGIVHDTRSFVLMYVA